MNKTVCRWTEPLKTPLAAWRAEKISYSGDHPGFINTVAYSVLALLTLISAHHLLQSVFNKQRYLVTDIYCLLWFSFTLWTSLCWFGVVKVCWEPISLLTSVLVVYRLVEILSRDLWVILYRDIPLTTVPRVLAVALLNYVTIIGLYGYLYQDGASGYIGAATISLTFSLPSDSVGQILELVQAAYCFIFSAIVISIFVGRVRLT